MRRIALGLICAWMTFSGIAQDKRVLMTIEDDSITVEDFLAIYNKNNTNNVVDKKTMDEYLDLFINFKLKVKAAEDLGMDTVAKFVNELEGYRRQLAKPYLVDREMTDALMQEAYDRMTQDIAAYHILVKIDENAAPKDTLAALKKLKGLAKDIKSENDMKLALNKVRASNDQQVIAEDLGYFTAFSMVYPFENAAYNTEVGTLSEPVRTRFGYHVIFVRDKRPARGQIKTSHIMVSAKEGMTEEELTQAKAKIDEIYQQLVDGEEFAKLAREYSDDKGSAKDGGKLPWFGTGRMVSEFEDAAFSIEKNGMISEPIKTRYGWHIIKRDDYKGIGTYDELEGTIKQRIERDSRGQKGRWSLLKKLKSEYAISYNYKNRDAVHRMVGSEYLEGRWKPVTPENLGETVIVISDNKYSNSSMTFTQEDYFVYLRKFQRRYTDNETLKDVLADQWEGYINACVIDFENSVLADKHPDFRALMQEYHDGILLFDLMDQKVWSKAVEDTTGLEEYYEANKTNYMWGKRVDASIYMCANEDAAKQTMKMAKKRLKKGYADSDILTKINEENPLNLVIRSGVYAEGADEYLDQVTWAEGIQTIDAEEGRQVIVQIYSLLDPAPKALDECRGLVTSAYQDQLEKQWISDLRDTYTFKVDEAVFDSINK